MKKQIFLLIGLFSLFSLTPSLFSQNLPDQMRFSPDGQRLITGGLPSGGVFEESTIKVFELWFDQTNYWQTLTNNYQSATDLPATLIADGDTLASKIGVRFKGQTSYSMTQNSQKKSFNLTIDYEDPNQDVDGYETFNLNNCFDDPTFVREVLYLHQNRQNIPAAQACYAHLFINGQNWGLYPMVQSLDSDYIREWFLSDGGTRWRALRTDFTGGPGGGMGGPFGTGYCSLNYLGADTTEYAKKYTLKKTSKDNPWEDLIRVCDKLENTPDAQLEDSLRQILDLDRTLWFLAEENVFSDDDGYIHKGGMDYYLYWDDETGWLTPLEYDGNTVMTNMNANWSPFENANDERFALMYNLFAVPNLRQRYLAHYRTLLSEVFNPIQVGAQIDAYYELIDSLVQDDPKKLYTYAQFTNGKQTLKNFVTNRSNLLNSNTEMNVQGLSVSDAIFSADSTPFTTPDADQEVTVTASVSGSAGVNKVNLYYGGGFAGVFEKTAMFDDGSHGDGAANDDTFGATIPGFPNGTYVRFYVEAIANNTPKTATYFPAGAEHDVFIYRVNTSAFFDSEVVVNEIMASNTTTAADQDGQFDDWIELYNTSASPIDLSGWHLTDNESLLDKWTFPDGTVLPGNGYLIVWTDENGSQAGLHANFKLSASGETVLLTDADLRIGQQVAFADQVTDFGYARVPNGTGDFVIQAPTFNANNEVLAAGDVPADKAGLVVFPNPAQENVTVVLTAGRPAQLRAFDALGRQVLDTDIFQQKTISLAGWVPGMYWLMAEGNATKLIVR